MSKHNFYLTTQQYELFTAGNIKWKLEKDSGHLASRDEIMQHFQSCMDTVKKKPHDISEIYNCTYIKHTEVVRGGNCVEVEIMCRDNKSGRDLHINAKKLVKAAGFDIPINKPLEFTSQNMKSISVEDPELSGESMQNSDKAVYIVGGGKTAIDTAHHLIKRYPSKQIHLIIGKGTTFVNREKIFAEGIRKYLLTGNTTVSEFMAEHALLYDGENEAEVMNHLKLYYGVYLDPTSEHCILGILSEEENEFVREGIHEVISEYVLDIKDATDNQLVMEFRSGRSKYIEKGSWIINCTGYLYRKQSTYEPYLSKNCAVLSIQQTSGIMIFPSIGSYFLAALFFLDILPKIPLYELDHETLCQKNKTAYLFITLNQLLYNMMLIADHAPLKVMYDCDLNFDKWYPLYRQLKAVFYMKYYQSYHMQHFKTVLDYVQKKYDIHCGVLEHVTYTPAPVQYFDKKVICSSSILIAILGTYLFRASFL